jgi:tetratricopeptide (TPR) repeat protein
LQAFRRFVAKWPDDPLAEGARESIGQLEPTVEELLKDSPFPKENRLALAAMHEDVLGSLAAGDYARVIRLCEQLLQRCPDFVPAMNNLTEAYFRSGRADEAIDMSRRVLQREPDNFHALANLARHLLLAGRYEEAEAARQQLQAARSERGEIWCKKAETFSFFGDDEAVLAALAEAEQAGWIRYATPEVALLFHLAGVACARQGNWNEAKRHWRQALQIYPGLDVAEDNLADAKRPIGERHGPWAFGLAYWIPKTTIDRLAAEVPATGKDDEGAREATLRFVERQPAVAAVVPMLLDRGDERGRGFAYRLAMLLATPEMHDALRALCLSQRGPDSLRIEIANRLDQRDVMPEGRVRMWIEGEWRELELMGFEITPEAVGEPHLPQAEAWAYEALEALRRDDGPTAEKLLTQCIELEGERPDLLNNLGTAYQAQGRNEEALELIRQVHQRWPDYFFGRIAMAFAAIKESKYDEAEAFLAPLRRRKRLHHTEFTALCVAYIQLFIGKGQFDGAQEWLGLLKKIEPDHPQVARFERLLNPIRAIGSLFGLRRK